ncbi:AAA family ATPase [Flavobacterium sp. UW10123]|uniref:AAA family ATPase n=1 Tax=Flavobacterium sp. UW10123 TaxID=3230800 RepID=UPI003390C75A
MSFSIQSQNADKIFNVAGNLNISNSPEVLALINEQKQQKLQELYSVSFFDALTAKFEKKKLIERSILALEIKDNLEKNNQLVFYGEPGIGKTTILFQYAKTVEEVIYISVKDKSPISVYIYLTNKIRLLSSEELIDETDADKTLEWLQSSLQRTRATIIIDDCEQLPDAIYKIAGLEKFNSKFLFATRNKSQLEKSGLNFFQCLGFSDEEIRSFLHSYGKRIKKLEFNEIKRASKGNPLYLFYLTVFEMEILPENLAAFQDAIWKNLSEEDQECLILISVPQFNLSIIQLAELQSTSTPLKLATVLERLSALVYNINGVLQIFHPVFKEFILSKIRDCGLLDYYLNKLGDYFLAKKEIVQATYLLIDTAPEKVDEYLFGVFPELLDSGELQFAIKVITRLLKKAKRKIEKGYLYYHLSNASQLLGLKDESSEAIDNAIFHLKKLKNKKLLQAAMIFKASYLAEQGEIEAATEIADKIFAGIKAQEKEVKAPLLITLAKIYVDISEINKAAIASKEAFEIFDSLGDSRGMISSLANLVSSLAQSNDYRDEAEKYGLKLLEILKDNDTEFSIEVVVLNSLTSICRQKREFGRAKKYCQKAIELCQKYEMKDRTLLNLINYGNVLRDEENIDAAIEIYNEGLVYAIEYNSKKNEGRIYRILAGIEAEKGNLDEGLDFAEKAIIACSSVNYYYGCATALEEKAEILELKNELERAAKTYIDSADYYLKMEQYSETCNYLFRKAIELYNTAAAIDEKNILTQRLIENAAKSKDFSGLGELITANFQEEDIINNFRILFNRYFGNRDSKSNIIQEFLIFKDYCKDLEHEKGKEVYKDFLNIILKSDFTAKYSYSILGLAIEQSENLISEEDLIPIVNDLAERLPFFALRSNYEDFTLLATITDKNIEIKGVSDELISIKLAISLVLILTEEPELLFDEGEVLEQMCAILLLPFSSEVEEILKRQEKNDSEYFSQHFQSIHMGKTAYDVPEMIILSPEFERKCSLAKESDDKGLLSFYLNTVLGLREHFYHNNIKEDATKRKKVLHSIACILGYANSDNERNDLFSIDLSKVSAFIKKPKKAKK